MPQPQAPKRVVGQRGNSAMAEFKPKRWQVEDHCGICRIEFSLLNARHHCRSCGLSVCGKHSKNKVIVPTSLSKVPQRVCDKCYPKCCSIAMGLAAPSPARREIPNDKVRRHTMELTDERNDGHRIRSPPEGLKRAEDMARRDNRTWNGGGDDYDPVLMMRRDGEPRIMQSARGRRLMSPRANSPHGIDPRQVVSSRGRPARNGDLHPSDLINDIDRRRKRELREKERRTRDPREKDPRERNARERDLRERNARDRDPRERNARERDPRERDARERELCIKDLRERDMRGKDPREMERRKRDPREKDPHERERRERGPREKDPRERERRERDPREKDPRERERRERDPREKDSRGRERRERDPRARDPREKERRDRDPRARDPREKDRRDRALHERDLFDDAPRDKLSRGSLRQKERRHRGVTPEEMRSPAPSLLKRGSGKLRDDTSSTCRTASSTLTSLYAALNGSDDIEVPAPPPRSVSKRRSPSRKEKEKQSAFADSTFSIFSLAGSDHSDSESKAANDVGQKVPSRRLKKVRSNSMNRESLEKKEHLDFSASSSSIKSLEVSAITQKYLKPEPAKAAMKKVTLQPMIEDDIESDEPSGQSSRRKANPRGDTGERRRNTALLDQAKDGNKAYGERQSSVGMLPPFKRGEPIDMNFRDSCEENTLAHDKVSKPKRTLCITEYDEFEATQISVSSDSCLSDDKVEDEAFAELLAASNRGKQDLTAKLWAKKAAVAGIDPASLEAKEKAPTTANYKLTKRDEEIMGQVSELEATVLQHQKELTDLLDMYGEATKRAQKAQKELQNAKVRVSRYEKAHAAVSRAIRSGKLYMQQKEYMAAILELSRAIGIERSNATLWYMLAECRLKVGQPAAAEDACTTSLKLHPTGAALAMLGRIMHERGRNDEATECYLLALGRNDESEGEEDSEYE
ncbi:unnamed protein product [Peronospora belbahrii]|uniref:FYVE-type domain-containing protein n=1 Tax=Peronospora belbahrii TaxID=622444 RepID=A0AAU9LN02_9STRA|nr:unnamed protein product [Peronospora belbahrii]